MTNKLIKVDTIYDHQMNSSMGDSYLVADIGGTNARFAIYSPSGSEGGKLVDHARFSCSDFDSLSAVLKAYLEQNGRTVDGACISIAAPVDTDQIRMTNLDWTFSVDQFKRDHGLKEFWVINDATAGALATTCAAPSQLEIIKSGEVDDHAVRINLIPGTGFGVGGIIPRNGNWIPIQGEGGHATLAAVAEEEFAVLRHITSQIGRAINDRVLSGPGMLNLYQALAAVRGQPAQDFNAQEMTSSALDREDALCVDSLDLYCTLFGRLAGDLALTLNAHGGVYLSGNLMRHIGVERISLPFNKGFTDKGTMTDKVERIPVSLLNRDHPGLLGASVWLDTQLSAT